VRLAAASPAAARLSAGSAARFSLRRAAMALRCGSSGATTRGMRPAIGSGRPRRSVVVSAILSCRCPAKSACLAMGRAHGGGGAVILLTAVRLRSSAILRATFGRFDANAAFILTIGIGGAFDGTGKFARDCAGNLKPGFLSANAYGTNFILGNVPAPTQ
jgi:hypothetical protein